MIAKKHKLQTHHLHFIQIVALVMAIIAAIVFIKELNTTIITLVALAYFIVNIIHAHSQNQLTTLRVMEFGLITAVFEFLLLSYLI